MRFLAGFVSALLLLLVAGAVVIYAGGYNVAATRKDTAFEHWLLSTAMVRSVMARADDIDAPQTFTAEQIQAGFREYHEMCQPCHGAPGKEDSEVRKGLNPRPPDLAEAVPFWNRSQLFWIVSHGVRMTGMPAFGPTHDESRLWNVVAFLETLPKLDAEQYREAEQALMGQPAQHEHENGAEAPAAGPPEQHEH